MSNDSYDPSAFMDADDTPVVGGDPAGEPDPASTASTEPPAVATAPPGDPAEPSPTATPPADTIKPHGSVYARRKAAATLAVAGVVVAGVWLTFHGVPGAAPSRADQIAAARAVDTQARNAHVDYVTNLIANDEAAAHAWQTEHGTLTGFTVRGSGARSAAAGPTMVASRRINGICYMYAVTASGDQPAQVDTTGQACTDAAIRAAQADLDNQAFQLTRAAAGADTAAFAAAAQVAANYALNSFQQGTPSLTGLPDDLGNGVRVVANHGTYLLVRHGVGVGCRQATIGVDGTVGEKTPC